MNKLSDYDFHLPPERIAQFPLQERTEARLMLVDREKSSIQHLHVRDLPRFLNPEDTLAVNNTKVIPARLIGNRSKSGGTWEGLFVGFAPENCWKLLCKTRGKLKPGETVSLRTPQGKIGFPLDMLVKLEDGSWIARPKTDENSFAALDRVGWIPIPPYIRKGRMSDSDKTDYQTVFASEPGAIAAPTAGFHFTKPLLKNIEDKGVEIASLTLHVGEGTFRPISSENLSEHLMHSEWGSLSAEVAEKIQNRRKNGRTIAVGTTSVRVLESAADPEGILREFRGETELFILPPYRFRAVDGLFTNFHFPKSTLYILVRTFGGDELIKRAYEEAIREEYRFFSYGDAMLIL